MHKIRGEKKPTTLLMCLIECNKNKTHTRTSYTHTKHTQIAAQTEQTQRLTRRACTFIHTDFLFYSDGVSSGLAVRATML